MVDRLSFVKTVEAIYAAAIILSMYMIVQAHVNEQLGVFQRNPITILNDFLRMINNNGLINEAISDYDYTSIDNLFRKLFLKSVYYSFEPTYFERVKVKASINESMPNISFTYHFPLGIDKNSVSVTNSVYALPTNALFNWYATPIVFDTDLNNTYVEVNITIDAQGIDNKTLMYFVNDKRSSLDIHNWSLISGNVFNATLILFVPEVKKNIKTYVYCAQNNSLINFTYPSLTKTMDVNYNYFSTFKSTMGQVVFTPVNVSSVSTDTYYITYMLYSNQDDNYANITLVDNSGITITPELNYLKQGSTPIYTTFMGKYSASRVFPKKGGFVKLTVYGGYP